MTRTASNHSPNSMIGRRDAGGRALVRTRSARVLVVAFALGVACSRSRPDPPDSAIANTNVTTPSTTPADSSDPRATILFVGTSLTAGYGLDPDSAFPQLVQQKIDAEGLRYRVENAGVSGETTDDLLRRLDWVLKGSFSVLVLETGANDGIRGVPPATIRANLDQILTRIRAARPDARLLLVQMEAFPNYGARYTAAFRALYPDLAAAHGVPVLPFLLDGVAGQSALNQSDGVHPNLAGERIVADNVWRALRKYLGG